MTDAGPLSSSFSYLRFYNGLLSLGLVADWVCARTIVKCRFYRSFPLFSAYVVYSAVVDTLGGALLATGSTEASWIGFLGVSIGAYCLEFGVLFEIVSRLLTISGTLDNAKQARQVLSIVTISALVVSSALSGAVVYRRVTASLGIFLRVELADGVCRALMFVGIFGLICILGIRKSQGISKLALYLGFYFWVAVSCQIAHEIQATHESQFDYFERIDAVRVFAWIITMILITMHVKSFHGLRPGSLNTAERAKSSG